MENKKIKRYRLPAKDEQGNYIRVVKKNDLVDEPAIECDYMYFASVNYDDTEFQFRVTADEPERMEITGPIMICDKDIIRVDESTGEKFFVYFTKQDVDDYMEPFLINNYSKDPGYMHMGIRTDKLFVKELWRVRDPNNDASNAMGFKGINEGSYMITYKCADPELWTELKASGLKGFSVEIYSAKAADELEKMSAVDDVKDDIEDILDELLFSKADKQAAIKDITEFYLTVEPFAEVGELSFADYPQSATDSAQKALQWKSENPESTCGTKIMWTRAYQIANRKPLSYSNLKRIALNSKLESKANSSSYGEGCMAVAWDAFGGTDLVYWAVAKLNQIDSLVGNEVKKQEDLKRSKGPYNRPF